MKIRSKVIATVVATPFVLYGHALLQQENADAARFEKAIQESADAVIAQNGYVDLRKYAATKIHIAADQEKKTARSAMEITLGRAGVFFERAGAPTVAAAACLLLSANNIPWPETAITQYTQAEAHAAAGDPASTELYLAARDSCLAAVIVPSELLVLNGFSSRTS